MEIKELLEIMLFNVEEGRDVHYGLVSIDGTIDINHPDKVFNKPHTYITANEYNEIRDVFDLDTVLNRLNLAIEKLFQAPVSGGELIPPKGYLFRDKIYDEVHEGRNYTSFIYHGWNDKQLINEGYLIPVAESLLPAVSPPLKPYINWVKKGCDDRWPDPDYLFTEDMFRDVHPSDFRVELVSALRDRLRRKISFAFVVANTYPSKHGVSDAEDLVNDILNKLYQNL